MKRLIYATTPVLGMALINPPYQKNTTIEVDIWQKNEGIIPHIHVYTDKTNAKCAIVRLDKAEYSDHHDNPNHPENCKLTSKEIDELIAIMTTPWSKRITQLSDGSYHTLTGYEAAVEMWVEAFGEPKGALAFNYDSNGLPIMPDYRRLNKI